MVRNNHLKGNRGKLDELLRTDSSPDAGSLQRVLEYARSMADVENVLAVVSDMGADTSHIFAGGFARNLDLEDYREENSIWENRILRLMTPEQQEEKYMAELRFFHFLRHLPKSRRSDYYLAAKLRFRFADGEVHDVLHRMYYIFGPDKETIRYAVCLYGPLVFDFSGKSRAVNSVSGISEELGSDGNGAILSPRERQILSLIDSGLKSKEIAERLCISIHTVSRHRQEIIASLQAKNTHEACRLAKSLKII